MKKLSFVLFWILSVVFVNAQNNGFNYKAQVSDNGNVVANQSIEVRFTILEDGTTSVYEETQTATTDDAGIFAVNIGEGTVVSGDFSTINWANEQFLKVEINTGSGYTDFGTTAFHPVPTAKYADRAGNVFSGSWNDLTDIPSDIADGDDDTHLTEAEVDNYVSNNGYLTSEVDGSTTNELQDLSLSGTSLSITNGTGVNFSGWDTNAGDDVQAINDLSDGRTTNYGIFLGNNSGTNANIYGDLIGVGKDVMTNATGADYSVGIGNQALNSLTSGYQNVAVGISAGQDITTASNNVFIGFGAGANATGSGNIFIGSMAGIIETGDNKLYIENSASDTPLIGGDFSTDEVTINGSLSIKDGTQGDGKVLVSDANGKASWQSIPQQDKVMVLSPVNFVRQFNNNVNYVRDNSEFYYNSGVNEAVYMPINLPVGAYLDHIVIYYVDNSSSYNLYFSLNKTELNNSGVYTALDSYTTSGTSSSLKTQTLSANETVNSNYSYTVEVVGNPWDGYDTRIIGVKVYYKE